MLTIVLTRKSTDLPTPSPLKGILNKTLFIHPENDKHPTDQVQWLVNLIETPGDYIIKTHSEHIVSALGHLIAAKKYSRELVKVDLYDNGSLKRSCQYTDDGGLMNWYFGWFLPDIDIWN